MSSQTSQISGATHTTSVNGIEMYYETYGQDEPLVLLHGFLGSGADWGQVFKGAPDGYRSVIPDLRGHGRSTNPTGAFTMRRSAEDVLALLDALNIQRCKGIGVSAGAQTLLQMAAMKPDRVEAMVLVSGAHYFPEQARAIMRTVSPFNQSEEEWHVMRQRHKQGDDQIRALWKQANTFKDSYEDMTFTPPQLATIKARTLIVQGDHDPFYPVSLAVELFNAIPRSYLWIVPNGGHGPIFGERSAAFVETCLAFLRGAWEPGKS
ncbi:MAG: alpha/beta hydrolase [Bryobacteraceae bacterium]|jgi:pimeloyl-ACP methyl ester carboxylesterase